MKIYFYRHRQIGKEEEEEKKKEAYIYTHLPVRMCVIHLMILKCVWRLLKLKTVSTTKSREHKVVLLVSVL